MTIDQIQTNSGVGDTDFSSLLFNRYRYLPDKRSLVSESGKEIRLRAKTQKVFELLASNANVVVTRETLATSVWKDVIVGDDTLNRSIREIRIAIGDTERKILETLPRQGYMLHVEVPFDPKVSTEYLWKKWSTLLTLSAAAALVILSAVYFLQANPAEPASTAVFTHSSGVSKVAEKNDHGIRERLHLSVETAGDPTTKFTDRVVTSVISELSRYSNIEPKKSNVAQGDYHLELSQLADDDSLFNLQLRHVKTAQLVLAENLKVANPDSSKIPALAGKIAALIGSPAGGAIGSHLLKISSDKPVDALTRPECLAHGYDCTSCSGEFDSVTPRAVQCLANILNKDPDDPDAWALQSTVYSRQYFWGSTLDEPLRSNLSKRGHLKKLAVDAATNAEGLSYRASPSVYWGMVQAYLASCNTDKLYESVKRGLQINPNDPVLLGSFGNFAAYAGKWNEGVDLIHRAINLDPENAKKWWFFALGKNHYRKGEYDKAYQYFLRGLDERNWLSHIQLAYTLPFLERHEDAKESLRKFNRVAPGMTLEHVLEFYRSYCFDDEYIGRIRSALESIHMPSRSMTSDLKNPIPVGATVIDLNGRRFEYIDVGDGTPIIFVHGSFSDYRTWSYMKIPVSENNRFISYTLRHFGTQPWHSEKVTYDFNYDQEELIDFIEHLNIGAVVLVGWSRGVQPAAMVARSRPDLVSKLVLYEGTITGLDDSEGPEIIETLQKTKQIAEMEQAVEEGNYRKAVVPLFEIALQYPPNTFEIQPTALKQVVLDNARTLTQLFSEQPPHQPEFTCEFYSTVHTPTLVIHGENTDPWWQFESENISKCMPDAVLGILAEATHDGPLSNPEALTEMIAQFIAK